MDRYGLSTRSARVQQYSPDPEDAEKVDYLEQCLRETAEHPDKAVVLFMDEMGYYRWPSPAADWTLDTDTPVAQRAGANNQQWRIVEGLQCPDRSGRLSGWVYCRSTQSTGAV